MVLCTYMPKLVKNYKYVIEKLLQNGVAVAPGSGFGDRYENYIRISTCIDENKLSKGLDIINQVVTSL
jgi:aspartate aminotransferase